MPEGDNHNQKHRGKKPARCGSSDLEQNSSIGRTSLYIGTAERASGESKRNFKKGEKRSFSTLIPYGEQKRKDESPPFLQSYINLYKNFFSFAVMPEGDSHN